MASNANANSRHETLGEPNSPKNSPNLNQYKLGLGNNPHTLTHDIKGPGAVVNCMWLVSVIVIALTFPISLFMCIKVIQEYQRAVIFRMGRLVSAHPKGPGMIFIIPWMDDFKVVDMRTFSFDVPPQEILTRDSVTVAVDAVVYYRVQDAVGSVVNVEDAKYATRLLAASTLRNLMGNKNLSDILSAKQNLSATMQGELDLATDAWGIKVERVEVTDVRLPVQLQRAMAAEAEASREAKAKIVAAEGEVKASIALKDAADVIAKAPVALQLRYLQTLNFIAAEKNSTIIFPLPIDILGGFTRTSTDMST